MALLIGTFVPIASVIRLGFYETNLAGGEQYVGLQNYVGLLSDARFWNAAGVSVRYSLGVVLGSLCFGLAVALLLNRSFWGRGILRSAFLIPWATPLVTAALILGWMFDSQYGVVNYALESMRLPLAGTDWLNTPSLALLTVTAMQIWRLFPLATLMYLAALQNISSDLYEAAAVDGAAAWHRFRYVTLPSLRRVTAVLVVLLTIWSFGTAFTIIFLLTGGGPAGATENLPLLTYLRAFKSLDFGLASALGTIVLLVSLAFTILYLRAVRER
jgi:multiple sugar transport system permease protein